MPVSVSPRLRLCLTAWLGLAGLVAAGSAGATQTVLSSKAPYWLVGPRDRQLSALCAVGRFNQREPGRYVARFEGAKGPAVLGIAKGSGLNLADPDRRAVTREDYFFLGDGTSDCSVFVGGRTGATAPPPGATGTAPQTR